MLKVLFEKALRESRRTATGSGKELPTGKLEFGPKTKNFGVTAWQSLRLSPTVFAKVGLLCCVAKGVPLHGIRRNACVGV